MFHNNLWYTVKFFIKLFSHAWQQLLTIAGVSQLLDDFDWKTADCYSEHCNTIMLQIF